MDRKRTEALEFIRTKSSLSPEVGVILGSGLGAAAETLEIDTAIPFDQIPNARASAIVGHSGRLILARAEGVPVVVMQGRVHYYEGYSMEDVLFLPRVMGMMGIKIAVVTNAAGGVNEAFTPGDLMLISDHINFFGVNPLRGQNEEMLGPRFPDLSDAYPLSLRQRVRQIAGELKIDLKEGVYLGLPGPTYETPAEIRAYRTLGADAVGMSTIPEVVSFAHMGIPVLGLSCITNMAAGILPQRLDHKEVLDTTARVEHQFSTLLRKILPALPTS